MIMAAEEIRGTKQRIAYTVMIVRDFGEAHHLPPARHRTTCAGTRRWTIWRSFMTWSTPHGVRNAISELGLKYCLLIN
jgi:hypothetical protein